MLMTMVYALLPAHPNESINPTSKLNCPTAVGVPETTPLAPSTSPGGKEPVFKENVTGGCPPLTVNALL